MKLANNREYFLTYLNNIRKEGIVSLKKKSFDSLCEIFDLMISTQSDDGLCMNTILILFPKAYS